MDKENLISWLKLMNVKGLGPEKLMRLFSFFDGVARIKEASNDMLLTTRIFNKEMIKEWDKLKKASDERFVDLIEICDKNNILIIPLIDKRYPEKLKRMPYPPKTLFLKGDISLLNSDIIAMVGSREPNDKAKEWAFNIAKDLGNKGYTIISGGAKGIDSVSHNGSLESLGRTICVLGSGILNPYPSENAKMFEQILEREGLLISEHLPTFRGSRIALLQRNRITSGLSYALILCAGIDNGGSMAQTDIAHKQRIPIFIPRLDMGIVPDEGLKYARKRFNAKEIEYANDLINYMKKEINIEEQKELFSYSV